MLIRHANRLEKVITRFIVMTLFLLVFVSHPSWVYAAKSSVKKEESQTKPVHTLFVYVKNLDELQLKLKEAKEEKKPVMIEFYASWCPACQSMDKYVFATASVQKLLRPFARFRVDLTKKNDDLMQIVTFYQVYGTPTFIFYDKNGEEYNTERFKSIDDFKAVLIKLGQ